jgi:TonB family protein
VHGVAVLSLKLLPSPSAEQPASPLVAFDASAVPVGAYGKAPATQTPSAPVAPGGLTSRSTLDRAGAEARGGDGAAPEDGLLLFSFPSTVTLTDAELNNFDKSQTHRLRTAEDRASLEQRRATPRPTDAVFLATGTGRHEERRKPSLHDSAQGGLRGELVPRSEPRIARSQDLSTGPQQSADLPAPTAQRPQPASLPRPKKSRGIVAGRGQQATSTAQVATARPNVDRGPAATTAPLSDERVRDDVDAELLAARLERSFVEASMQRAARSAQGVGGEEGAGVGLGNSPAGDGARALPYMPGEGSDGVLDTSDARYVRWFTDLRARVQNALVFPQERALAMDQGTTIYRVVVGRDGRMKAAPKLVRSSGFADLDRAAISAILEAAPFAPLPLELLPQQGEVAILMPIQFWNPMIR